MLSITDFTNEIRKQVIDFLPEEYQQSECRMETVTKNNGIQKTGITIWQPANSITPILYLDDFYREYRQGVSMNAILSKISDIYVQSIRSEIFVSKADFVAYDRVKDNITLKLVNRKANRQLLRELPHKDIEDLSITYQIFLPEFHDEGSASAKVTNQLMDSWEIDMETLHQTAVENSLRLEPPVFKSMTAAMGEIIMEDESVGDLFKDREIFLQAAPDMMYILTNRDKLYGASALVYPQVLEQISEVFPEGFYILPSSVHEVLIMPKTGVAPPQELGKMVREVNQKEVSKEEVLSDRVYEYDKDAKEFHQVAESLKKERGMER